MSSNNENSQKLEDIKKKLKISGITKLRKRNIKRETSKISRFDTKSFEIDYYLYKSHELGEEFLMQEMSERLRAEGWKTQDISGQLYSKKNAGLLTSRKPSEEEAEYLGKNVAIWSLTELFFEKVGEEVTEYDKLKASKEVSTDDIEVTDENNEVTEIE